MLLASDCQRLLDPANAIASTITSTLFSHLLLHPQAMATAHLVQPLPLLPPVTPYLALAAIQCCCSVPTAYPILARQCSCRWQANPGTVYPFIWVAVGSFRIGGVWKLLLYSWYITLHQSAKKVKWYLLHCSWRFTFQRFLISGNELLCHIRLSCYWYWKASVACWLALYCHPLSCLKLVYLRETNHLFDIHMHLMSTNFLLCSLLRA
jgi:hypothetical protein